MSELLRLDDLDNVRPNFKDELGSEGAADELVGEVLRTAFMKFKNERDSRYEAYAMQYDLLEDNEDPSIVDMSILSDDLDDVIDEILGQHKLRLTDYDREIIEWYLNSFKNPYAAPDAYIQRELPKTPEGAMK